MNFKEKLRQLEGGATRKSSDPVEKNDFEHLAGFLGGKILRRGEDAFVIVQSEKPLSERHGEILLQDGIHISGNTVAVASKKTVDENFDITRAIFLDTETTGLAGGTGTYVFQLGVGYIKNQAFHVDQFVLPRLSDENWMLDYLNQYFENGSGIISFNGKSFDVPLLQTRYIQNRLHSPLDIHQHFDLLHAARRIWKDDFGDCRLGTLEARALGFERIGDIPGEQIPQIYMNYLRFGEYRPLKPVLEHNRLDIISLLALVIKIAETIRECGNEIIHVRHKSRVAQLYAAAKNHNAASTIYKKTQNLEALSSGELAEHFWGYAQSLKKIKNYSEAEKIWRRLLDLPDHAVDAMIELAKYFEHVRKDFNQALEFTNRAIGKLEIRKILDFRGEKKQALTSALQHRKARLEKKLAELGVS